MNNIVSVNYIYNVLYKRNLIPYTKSVILFKCNCNRSRGESEKGLSLYKKIST